MARARILFNGSSNFVMLIPGWPAIAVLHIAVPRFSCRTRLVASPADRCGALLASEDGRAACSGVAKQFNACLISTDLLGDLVRSMSHSHTTSRTLARSASQPRKSAQLAHHRIAAVIKEGAQKEAARCGASIAQHHGLML